MYHIQTKMLPKNADPLFKEFCLTKNHKVNRQLIENYIAKGMDINAKFKDGKNILYALDFENMKHAINLGADINNIDNQGKNLFAGLLWDKSSIGAHTSYSDYKKYEKINFVYENIKDPFSFFSNLNTQPELSEDLYTPFSLLSLSNIQHMKINYNNEYNAFINITNKKAQYNDIFNCSVLWNDNRYLYFVGEGFSPYYVPDREYRGSFLGGYHTHEELIHFFDNMPKNFIKDYQKYHDCAISALPNRLRCTKLFSPEHFEECNNNTLNMLYIINEHIPITRDKLMLGKESDQLFIDFQGFMADMERKSLHDMIKIRPTENLKTLRI